MIMDAMSRNSKSRVQNRQNSADSYNQQPNFETDVSPYRTEEHKRESSSNSGEYHVSVQDLEEITEVTEELKTEDRSPKLNCNIHSLKIFNQRIS